MKNFGFKKLTYLTLIVGFAFVGFGIAHQAQAGAAGDIQVTVTTELAAGALSGATVDVQCAGGAYTNLGTTDGSGVITAAPPAGANCDVNGEALNIKASKNGYVTKISVTTWSNIANPNVKTVTGVQYGVKVTLDDETIENDNVTGATVEAGGTGCTGDGTGVYYCAVPENTVNTGVIALKDGYVQKTIIPAFIERVAGTDAQQIVGPGGALTTAFNFQFAQKVIATRQGDNAALSGATVTAGSSHTLCDEDGVTGVYYCPVPVGEDGSASDVSILKGGYVTNTSGSTSNRVNQTDGQGTVTVSGIQFAYTITSITTETVHADLTATVSTLEVGDDTARNTCITSGGVWYCPVLTTNSDGVTMIARVVKNGYVDKNTYALVANTKRATDATAQVTETINSVQYAYKVTAITAEQTAVNLTATVTSVALGNAAQTSCALSGSVWYCPVILANSSGTLTADVAKDGYVRKTNYALTGSSSRTNNIDGQVSVTIANILYAAKVTGVATELGGALNTVTVSTGTGFAVPCAESGTAWYCALPLDQTAIAISVAKDGYVTNTSNSFTADRTVETADQQTKAVTGVLFAYKVEGVVNEIGGALSSVTVETGNSYGTGCTENTGAWYCAVPLNDTEIAIRATKDGYKTNTSVSFGSDRTDAAGPQVTATVTGVLFAQKVIATRQGDGAALTGATVTAGSGPATDCQEYLSTGVYYCPVPIAKDGTPNDVTILLGGYVTNTAGSTTNRVAGGSDQGEITVSGIQFAYTITSITTETVHADLTATVSTLEVGDDTARNTCITSGGVWYCPVLTTNSDGVTMIARVVKNGYVDKNTYALVANTKRATDATAQVTETINSVQYAYKVTAITAEQTAVNLTATVTSVALGNAAQTSCALSGSVWYCPVILANSSGTLTADVAKDGYVRKTNYALTGSSSRTNNIDGQVSVTIANILYAAKVTGVATELGGALNTVTVSTGTGFAVPCAESGTAWYCALPLDQTAIAISVAKDGYVTNTSNSFTADRTVETADQQTKAVTGVLFSQKITVTREGDSAALTDATVSTTGPTIFVEGAPGVYYGAVSVGDDNDIITIIKDGYKTNTSATTSDRTIGEDPHGVATATALFQLKLISANELGTAINISALDAHTFSGSEPDYSSGNTAYWAITAAGAPLVVQKDGYVNAGTTNAGGLTAITTTAANQTVVTMGRNTAKTTAISGTGSNVKGLTYALNVTVQREGDNAAITGSTVTAGNSYGTNCAEDAFTGIHYCAIPLDDIGVLAKVVKSGYVIKNLTYTDRTAVTNPQGELIATLGTQVSAPTISLTSATTTQTTASIVFQSTATGTAYIKYGLSSAYGNTTETSSITKTSDATITLTGLTCGSTYHYSIYAKEDVTLNESHNLGDASVVTSACSVAATISAVVPSGITNAAATITWTTGVTSTDNIVEYGTTSAMVLSSSADTNPTSHSVALSGLTANAAYYYRVKSTAGGSTTYSDPFSFKTSAAASGVSASVQTLKAYATADGTYTNGWEFKFSVTVNDSTETYLKMKFADWTGASALAASSTMKIALTDDVAGVQAGTTGVSVGNLYINQTNANALSLVDEDPNTGGIQETIYVYVKVPNGTSGGSYSTSYGIKTGTDSAITDAD